MTLLPCAVESLETPYKIRGWMLVGRLPVQPGLGENQSHHYPAGISHRYLVRIHADTLRVIY